MVYAADAPATALLEMLVHVARVELLKMPFVVFEIRLDPDRHLLRLTSEELPENWQEWPWPASTQDIGSYWYESQASVVLEVPSAVVPYQSIYLVNVQHPEFSELEVKGPRDFPVDPRLGGTSRHLRRDYSNSGGVVAG